MKRLALLALLLLAGPAGAASCELSVTDLAFGSFALNAGHDIESSANITVSCVDDGGLPDVSYELAIDGGLAGATAGRQMNGPGALAYNLYRDAARTLVWGDGSSLGGTVAGSLLLPGLGAATHTVYGRIPGGQPGVEPGTYTDQLTITLSY